MFRYAQIKTKDSSTVFRFMFIEPRRSIIRDVIVIFKFYII